MDTEIIYLVQSSPFWDWRVVLDLFLGGAGVGALLFAIALDEGFKGKYARICHTAALLAPVLITAGLLLVMAKMGRPLHLFLTYTNFNPESPLWWGGIFQPLLVIGAFFYFLKWRHLAEKDPSRKRLGRILTPIALIVGAYHGLLLSLMVSRPLWNTGLTVVASLLGLASTGIAAVMICHLLRMKIAGRLGDADHVAGFLDDMKCVRNGLVGILLLQLGTYFIWWITLRFGALQDQQALAAAHAQFGTMFWGVGIGVGILLPLVLGGLSFMRGESEHRRFQIMTITVTSVFILIGGFIFRLAMVYGGQIQIFTEAAF